jgi:hypothetical protein
MAKDIGVIVALPPAVRDWVEAQAEDLGVTAAIWIRMLVVAAARGRSALPAGPAIQPAHAAPRAPAPAPAALGLPDGDDDAGASGGLDPDAWRGSPDDESPGDDAAQDAAQDADIDAIVAGRVAEAAASAPPAALPDAYSAPAPVILGPANGGGARPLRRPPPAYSPARQPSHLRGLM